MNNHTAHKTDGDTVTLTKRMSGVQLYLMANCSSSCVQSTLNHLWNITVTHGSPLHMAWLRHYQAMRGNLVAHRFLNLPH